MRILHSKHQKLILQCYPPGKGVDKKPNPSELSYLLYYASTRRVKLEKVIEFLKKKTRADVRGRKSGNLSVTLSIISSLIEKCYENLNAFAPQVCDILSAILPLKELPLCKAAVATYAVFCSKLDNALFTGDKGFVDSFSRLTQDLIAIPEAESALHATNRREWKMVSLRTCRFVFSCLGYSSQLSTRFIPASIAILAPTVAHSLTHESLVSRLKSTLNVEQGAGERLLTKINTGKSLYAVNYDVRQSFDEDSLSESDLGEEALLGLRTLFHTTLSHQISAATRSVVEHGFQNRKEGGASFEWGTTFLQVCASFIPVQLRFETLLTLLDSLSEIAEEPNAKAQQGWFLHMRHYAQYILSLVSSGFNMIGLSISDILLHFLTLKTDLHTKLSEKLTQAEVSELSVIYSKCICNLSSHIYYFDQVSDSIEGILVQVDSVLLAAEPRHAEKIYVLVLDLLNMISTIMQLLAVNSSAISWNHATLKNWDVSFQLLTFKKSYSKFSAMVSHDKVVAIQTKYLGVVKKFLDRDFFSKEKLTQDGDGISVYLEPNYKNYIQDRGNTLYSLLLHCGDYFQEDFFEARNAMDISKILAIIADITGVNFAHNFLSVFPLWQLQKLPDSRPPSRAAVAKDVCAYHLLTASVCTIDEKYQHLLNENIGNSSLARTLAENITQRTAHLWTKFNPETHVFLDQITLSGIEAFFSQTPLKQWLSPSNSVLIEFENGDAHHIPRLNMLGPELDDDISFLSAVPNSGGTLGLGTANDISSIYSGLHNNVNGHVNGVYRTVDSHTPDTSQITQNTLMTHRGNGNQDIMGQKRVLAPKAEDLRLAVRGKASFAGNDISSVRSLLHRPVITDMASILDDLSIEDESDIIV